MLARIFEWRLARYGVASFAGTVIDLGGLALLYSVGVSAGIAAGLAYGTGTIAHWFVSSRFVFPDRLARLGYPRGGQQILFVTSAILGLAITAWVVDALTRATWDIALAKAAAMIVSFLAVFTMRLLIVFRARK